MGMIRVVEAAVDLSTSVLQKFLRIQLFLGHVPSTHEWCRHSRPVASSNLGVGKGGSWDESFVCLLCEDLERELQSCFLRANTEDLFLT